MRINIEDNAGIGNIRIGGYGYTGAGPKRPISHVLDAKGGTFIVNGESAIDELDKIVWTGGSIGVGG